MSRVPMSVILAELEELARQREDNTTKHLLSTQANRDALARSIEQSEAGMASERTLIDCVAPAATTPNYEAEMLESLKMIYGMILEENLRPDDPS